MEAIQGWFIPQTPCFVLVYIGSSQPQLSEANNTGTSKKEKAWMVLQFIPDDAPVKAKMLYAASKQALLKDLGDAHFVYTLAGSSKV